MDKITEWENVESDAFYADIVAAAQPAVIRSLVKEWPAVSQCQRSAAAACQYFKNLDTGKAVYTIAAPPEAGGRFFYSDDLRGLNFNQRQIPLIQVLGQLQAQIDQTQSFSIAVQSLFVRDVLPEFENENTVELLDPSVPPTMWIGNQGKVAPHYDVHKNLACVVAGRRRFIVYPPEQINNLYLGPVLHAPGGVPISLVDVWNPDYERFPRYREAENVALEVVLEPGDAVYIPGLWWHAVQSLESVNVLVNYWWGGINDTGLSPNDSLLHAMMTMAQLDPAQRQAWREFFDYFVFHASGDPAGHLPDALEDIVTSLKPEQAARVREFLAQRLKN